MPRRRRLLKAGGLVGAVGVAGCAGLSRRAEEPERTTATSRPAPSETRNDENAESAIFVSPVGAESNPGTEDAPLGRIQHGLNRAEPGDTVRVQSGEYREGFGTNHPGEPGAPITITGPPDAVLKPPKDNPGEGGVSITHSHVHLKGLSLNGLADSDRADDAAAYSRFVVRSRPPTWQDDYPDYLTDIKIKPHRIGNAGAKLIATSRVNDLEIGEFELIGPAGARWYRGDEGGYVLGEVVSMGRSANNFGTKPYPWKGPDRSHNVHIHHIANLAGHEHTELVKMHAGMYGVTVEYCTDSGGFGREQGGGASLSLDGAQSIARWNRIANGAGHGARIPLLGRPEREDVHDQFGTIPDEQYPGRNNAVYGNKFSNLGGQPIMIDVPREMNGIDQQRIICGNMFESGPNEEFTQPCPGPIPSGDGLGHTGGDSPWA